MKTLFPNAKEKGLTLIELLVVIAVVAVLAAMLLPALSGGGSTRSVRCLVNQKQIAMGFIMWKTDHNDQFPWKVAATNAGTLEAANRGYAAPSFQCLSNYSFIPNVCICPTDTNRIQAANFAEFRNLNTSYFVSIDAGTNAANNILTGDRNLARNDKPINPGMFVYSEGANINWTRELHNTNPKSTMGVLSFGDGHAEMVKDMNLNSVFLRENLATNRLDVP